MQGSIPQGHISPWDIATGLCRCLITRTDLQKPGTSPTHHPTARGTRAGMLSNLERSRLGIWELFVFPEPPRMDTAKVRAAQGKQHSQFKSPDVSEVNPSPFQPRGAEGTNLLVCSWCVLPHLTSHTVHDFPQALTFIEDHQVWYEHHQLQTSLKQPLEINSPGSVGS